jgi:hypothetical protein
MCSFSLGPSRPTALALMQVVVLDASRCAAAGPDILAQNAIPGPGHFPPDLINRHVTMQQQQQQPVCRPPSANELYHDLARPSSH